MISKVLNGAEKRALGRAPKAECSSYFEWAHRQTLGANELTPFSFPSEMHLSKHHMDIQGSMSMHLLTSFCKMNFCPKL